MENKVFKVVLLQALPASGKSEVRNFMANIEPQRLQNEFHIGKNLQLDDFPYVHMMRRIDNELQAMGEARIFYPGEEPFIDGRDWGTLCALLNEDYHDLMNRNVVKPDSAAQLLFDRTDVLVLDHDFYRVDSLGIIASHGGGDYHKGGVVNGMNTEGFVISEHEGTQIKRGAELTRSPVLLEIYKGSESLKGVLLGNLRKAETLG